MHRGLAPLLFSLLFACSGSSAAVADPLGRQETPPGAQTPKEERPGQPDASGEAEADASAPEDGGQEAAADAGADAHQGADADSGAVVPPATRYGVRFDGTPGQRVMADFPAGVAGQTAVTIEGYFSINSLGAEGLLVYTPSAYCAAVTTGPYAGHVSCCPDQTGSGCSYSNAVAPLNQYLHVAYVLKDSAWSLYLDGALQVTTPAPYAAFPAPPASPKVLFGAIAGESQRGVVDEFRISSAARYNGAFAPPAHLDADADSRLSLLLDEGAGVTSGPATLYNGCSWVPVVR